MRDLEQKRFEMDYTVFYPLTTMVDYDTYWKIYFDGTIESEEGDIEYYGQWTESEREKFYTALEKANNEDKVDEIIEDRPLVTDGTFNKETGLYTMGDIREALMLPYVLWFHNVENWSVDSMGHLISSLTLEEIQDYLDQSLMLLTIYEDAHPIMRVVIG